MLKVTKDKDFIKVTEEFHSWNSAEVNTVLYDLKNKRSKYNDDPWYDMSQSAIDWVKKYYLPKLEINNGV